MPLSKEVIVGFVVVWANNGGRIALFANVFVGLRRGWDQCQEASGLCGRPLD